MIRPLRRCHRWLMPALFLLIVIAAMLAFTHRPAPGRVDALPAAIGTAPTARR